MATVGSLVIAIDADVEGLRRGLDRAAAEADRAARRIKAGLAPVREAAEAVERNLDLRARRQAAILEAEERILAVREQIARKEAEMVGRLVPTSVKEAQERARELRSALEELQAPLRAAQVPEEAIARMTQRFEEARRRLEAVTEQAAVLKFAVGQVGKAAGDFGKEFSKALDDLILKGQDLREVLRGLVRELQNILFQRLVREPVRRLADEIFGGVLSFGAGLLFGGGDTIAGGVGDSGGTGGLVADTLGFQHGGPIKAFQPAIVGEAGPELFVPRTSGTIIPNSALRGGNLSGATVFIDARGADRAGLARLERMLAALNASVEPRAVAAVTEVRRRDPRLLGPALA